jgi:transposase
VLSVDDWAEIRRLHRAEGLSIRAISRVRGVSRNTVRNALQASGPPRYQRRRGGSLVDVVEPRIRELLLADPRMPATVIAERIGWQRSIRLLSGRVAELRPLFLPPDPSDRTTYLPGEVAQHDFWFPPIELPVGFGQIRTARQLPVLTMITGYARHVDGVLIPSRMAEDLFAGWWQLIARLGAVPRTLVWDGEGAVGRYRRGAPALTGHTHAFRGVLGSKVIILKPADPEAKGLLERVHGYLETSFLPGRAFTGPVVHWTGRLQRPVGGVLHPGEPALAAVFGLRPDRSDRRGHCGDAAGAAGATADRLAQLASAAPRLLPALGLQRLLGGPAGDRPADRGGGRPGTGPGLLRRATGG